MGVCSFMYTANMMKSQLDLHPNCRNLLFRRGYILTNRTDVDLEAYPFYGNWSKHCVTESFILYLHKEQHFYVQSSQNITALLIGHAYNPFTMQADENVILQDCIAAYLKSETVFFDKVSELTGIHLIALFTEGRALFVQDCSGMEMCCYGKQGKNLYLTSCIAAVGDIDNLARDKFADKLLASRSYRFGSKYLPGDLTGFKDFYRLGPNVYLEYKNNTFDICRFYPAAAHKTVDENNTEVVSEIARLLKNSVSLCAEKWKKPAISLSGGTDSRTTLSAANGSYDKFYYYSFESKMQEKNDAEAAHNICSDLGLEHTIYPITENNADCENYELFREIVRYNSAGVSDPPEHEIRKYIFLSTLDDFEVELKSWASEIGRAFWGRRYGITLPEKLTPRHFSIFQTRFIGAPLLLKQSDVAYRTYMEKSDFESSMYNYEQTDMFYWEYRFGSWGTIVTTGQNIFNFEVTMPMNNRKIMDMFLWYPHATRVVDGVHQNVIKANNPNMKNIGNHIHNDYLDKKRLFIERMYYYYRTIFYKKK